MTGEPLAPMLPGTAQAQRNGELGAGHVAVIRSFSQRLPDFVDVETRQKAEAQLARLACAHRPDELSKLADKLIDCLNPDGDFTDHDRARRRGIIIGRQDIDGMSPISGYLTPEARATFDAVLAKLAAPGMCNSADDTPCVSGSPSQAAIDGDTRSAGQRNHDALLALARATLASGDLGTHNGLPASIIVSTTLEDLEAGCGKAPTGGGSLLPMSDVIRLASHAHHYLAIFDKGKAIGLSTPNGWPHQDNELCSSQRPWLFFPRLRRARLPHRSPPRHALGSAPRDRHQQPRPGLRIASQACRAGLDNPQAQNR